MAEATPVQPLSQRLEVLAALEPSPFPVLSLYLRLAPNQNGREDQFLRKVFSERATALPEQSSDRESFDELVTRAQQTAAHIRFIEDASPLPMSAAWTHC